MSESNLKSSIYDEIEKHWRAAFAKMHRDPCRRDGFDELLLEAEAEARTITTAELQPHLAILEFGLEFLAYVHVALASKDGIGPSNEDTRAAWALVGAAVSFGVSIRSLVVSGLDTPARALLRTYVETLLLTIAVLHDRALGTAYLAADTDTQVKNFWHSTASPKKLHARIVDIERRIGFDDNTIEKFIIWRREEYEVLSQSSHLSYLAAAMTTISGKLGHEDTYATAIFGLPSANSPRTVFYAAATTWYFSRVANSVLLGYDAEKCAIVLDNENEWHQRIVAARDTLSDVMLKHWTTGSSDRSKQ